ncbi:hypothetical protein AWL63_01570 [Sphingomonas panacis]|uniref:Methyltransferase n=2 Tax=Sphingomonas panacis TaxID=1560345 RepID=A0A1B3ZG82_9SPHN|nr:hypothetical protein AWL63_01570 [Sphingomonas panacis]
MNSDILLNQIDSACRRLNIAQTTFGRQAVNDGKFVTRLQQGGRVTLKTVERVHRFIAEREGSSEIALRAALQNPFGNPGAPEQGFRFYDNRQKYLMFVNTSSEKQIIADRAIKELAGTSPLPPALRLFDGGAGDGTALARLLRGAHRHYPWLPFYVVAKEISMENVRLALEKMPDRLQEHPATVLVMTNLRYCEAPWLAPDTAEAASAMVWREVALEGTTAGDFEEQLGALTPFLSQHWQARVSVRTGKPVYRTPVVLVIHRKDNRFPLDAVLPQRGAARADFDFVLLSQPYRARAPLDFKSRRVVAPLVRSLRAGGKLMGVHSHGQDPGMEILRAVWPGENPFDTGRTALMQAVRADLGGTSRDFHFHKLSDANAVFRYDIHTLPDEIDGQNDIGSSTLWATWNAATYVGQIDDARLSRAMTDTKYLDVTRDALRRHKGLWFNDEVYLISRKYHLGS